MTFHRSWFSCIAEQIVVCQYHRSWRKCGGETACACRRGTDRGRPSVTDHGQIVPARDADCGLVPQITEEIMDVFSCMTAPMIFSGASMTHSSSSSRAGVTESPGVSLPGGSSHGCVHAAKCGIVRSPSSRMLSPGGAGTMNFSDLWPHTFRLPSVRVRNNNSTIWRGSVLAGEELPPHSGELSHALSHVGGPNQSQLSRAISMKHRLRRKHLWLNCDTNASNEMCLKDRKENDKRRNFLFCEKTKNGKHEKEK